MSAPTTRDPLVVNTQDGSCWTRRAVNRAGRGLYALADVTGPVPELVLASLTELAEHGLASMADCLPVPAGAASQLSEADALKRYIVELEAQRERRRLRLIALQNDALNMRVSLSPMGEDRKVPFPLGETLTPAVDWLIARVAELEAATYVAPSPSCTRCYGADAVRFVTNGGATTPCRACGPSQVEQLQARVAELEAQRAALAVRLRAGQTWERGRTQPLVSEDYVSQRELREIFGITLTAPWDAPAEDPCHPCGCPKRFDRHAWGCPSLPVAPRAEDVADIATLAPAQAADASYDSAFQTIQLELTATKEQWAAWQTALDVDLARTTNRGGCVTSHATWRGVHVVICCWFVRPETEGEHYASVHHDYRVSHDLPETGGAL